jgi:hypothetical protein
MHKIIVVAIAADLSGAPAGDALVNRHAKGTLYRRRKGTPFVAH